MYQLKEDEVWVKGYEGRYFVNRDSEVWSVVKKTPKKLTGGVLYNGKINKSTYRVLCLTHGDGVSETKYLHRVVAEAFLPNPEGKPTVNHINGKKQDNRLENLEWATWQEQVIHAYGNLKRKGSKIQVMMQDKGSRDREVDLYIKYGNGALKNTITKYITDEDFIRNGVPPELWKVTGLMQKSVLDKWLTLLVIGCCLDNGKSLSVTAKLTGLDQSTISKFRSGGRGVRLLEVYHKYKSIPEYIDRHIAKISLAYNGNQ